jgi:hypothetical protein
LARDAANRAEIKGELDKVDLGSGALEIDTLPTWFTPIAGFPGAARGPAGGWQARVPVLVQHEPHHRIS